MSLSLETRQLTLRVGTRVLLRALDWRINAGECWCIIGRNGAGKTTLLRTLAGLRDASTVWINERRLDSWSLGELARLRAYLPQGRNDAFAYSALESVLAARHPYHDGHYWESERDLQLAQAALAEFDVADLALRDVRSLSGGERQRVALAALLAQDADCMLLDEPTNALDLSHQIGVMQLIAKRAYHKAVIIVSHDLNLAFRFATHALLLMPDGSWHAGPVRQIMTPELLGRCLAHPIEIVQHGEQQLFVPN